MTTSFQHGAPGWLLRDVLLVCSLVLGCHDGQGGADVARPEPLALEPAAVQDEQPAAERDGETGLPAVDARCQTDEGCAVTHRIRAGEYACCHGCVSAAGSVAWVERVERACAEGFVLGSGEPSTYPNCPPLACPMPPSEAVCRDHRCEVQWGDGVISPLERCRAAARTFCERFDFPTSKLDELKGPPRDGPIALMRDDHLTDAYRWLGNGRGDVIVQCEVDLVTGKLTVYGGFSHREFGPWAPYATVSVTNYRAF